MKCKMMVNKYFVIRIEKLVKEKCMLENEVFITEQKLCSGQCTGAFYIRKICRIKRRLEIVNKDIKYFKKKLIFK